MEVKCSVAKEHVLVHSISVAKESLTEESKESVDKGPSEMVDGGQRLRPRRAYPSRVSYFGASCWIIVSETRSKAPFSEEPIAASLVKTSPNRGYKSRWKIAARNQRNTSRNQFA